MDRQIVRVRCKRQFEAGRESVGKGGICRDEQAQQSSLQKVRDVCLPFSPPHTDAIDSPILGAGKGIVNSLAKWQFLI